MNKTLQTAPANNLFEHLKPVARDALVALNELRFLDSKQAIAELHTRLAAARAAEECPEDYLLNDFYILNKYVGFLSFYVETWHRIIKHEFSTSWNSLQDSLDLLRLIKRFSGIDISFFETQLVELERTYPYNVFFSIAATVDHFECSICGLNLDSHECPHMRGQLYAGVMAYGIARKIREVDHVSIVTHPRDKRCVVRYDDSGEQFKLVRHLSTLVASKKFQISDFAYLRFSKRQSQNPDYQKLGRNERCFCGSGMKFKRCCISKVYVERDHVDIVAEPRRIESAVA